MEVKEIREKGINVLRTVLNREQNILILEKNIFNNGIDNYIQNIYETIKDIKDGIKLNTILENIKKNKVIWKHQSLNDYIFEEEEQNNFIIQPFEVYEGALVCKCGSKRVYSYQKQSRSADEPMSTYATCMACKSKWVYSG
jgi:DNA-directed RNA polymerase subunit M/transcription elongation factor TFIIS